MSKTKLLKYLNPMLPTLLTWQVVTALSADHLGSAFRPMHLTGGLLLVAVAATHLTLNWSWVRSTYLKRPQQ